MRWFVSMLLLGAAAEGTEIAGQSERTMEFEIKLGPFYPLVDRQPAFATLAPADRPYQKNFLGSPMLFGEIEVDREIFQRFGTFSLGAAIGYGEKFGRAVDAITGQPADESTGIRLVPFKALAIYRWDWAAQKYDIPLVPYFKAAFVMAPWWVTKGKDIEVADGVRGAGIKFGGAAVFGLALQLDFLDPRLARDFDTSAGVNHTYLFVEYAFQELTLEANGSGFGATGLDLSSRHWMFGLSFEF